MEVLGVLLDQVLHHRPIRTRHVAQIEAAQQVLFSHCERGARLKTKPPTLHGLDVSALL